MAGRILNRRELRRQADAAADADAVEGDEDGAESEEPAEAEESAVAAPKARAKAKAPARPRKPRKAKAAPRLCARWGVFDVAMKQVAVFDYKDRPSADAKVAELKAKKNAHFFLQIVKEPMPEAEPAVPS